MGGQERKQGEQATEVMQVRNGVVAMEAVRKWSNFGHILKVEPKFPLMDWVGE